MLNDPSPEEKEKPKRERRPHPLEAPPQPGQPASEEEQNRQRIVLHIPVVQPNVTYALIAINSVIFFVAFYVLSNTQLNNLYDWGASNRVQVLEFGEYHRLFTVMFLHGSLIHIFFNMYSLYIIGRTVERFFGHLRFTLVYFLGGLTGSLMSILLNGPEVFSVGASGAVFAVFGAEIVFIYKHRKLLGEMGRAQLRQLLIIAGLNFFIGFASSFGSGGVQIDNWGHVGGFIGGLVIAWLIGPIFIFHRHPNDPKALQTEDINPLEKQFQSLLAYVSVLLIILIVATFLSR